MILRKVLNLDGDDVQLRLEWDWKTPYFIKAEVWIDGLKADGGALNTEELLTFTEVLKAGVEVAEKTDKRLREND